MRKTLNYSFLGGLIFPLLLQADTNLQTALSSPEAIKGIDQNAFLNEYDLDHFPAYVDDMSPEEMLYRQFKIEGKAAPDWLRDTIFPQEASQLRNVGRDGGDSSEDATLIEDTSFGSCYNDTGATDTKTDVLVPQELPQNCNSSQFASTFEAPDAWYEFTLDVDTFVEATTCMEGTGYDTAIAILDSDLIPYAVNDDTICAIAGLASGIYCTIPAGTYYVVVDGFNAGSSGAYELEVCFSGNPCETYNAAVQEITAPLTFSGSTVEAPNVYGGLSGNNGYILSVPQTGIYDITACNPGTDFATDMWLFTANPCDEGELIVAILDTNCPTPFPARISGLQIEAGEYHLNVGSTTINEGNYEITITVNQVFDEITLRSAVV